MTEIKPPPIDDPGPPPGPEAAATERAPNRRPRWNKRQRMWETRKRMATFLRVYRYSGDVKQACKFIDIHEGSVNHYKKRVPEFKEAFEEATRMWEDITEGRMRGLAHVSIETLEDIMENSTDDRLKEIIAHKVLRSRGIMPDRPQEREEPSRGGPAQIIIEKIIVNPPAGAPELEAPREIIEGDMTEIEPPGMMDNQEADPGDTDDGISEAETP